LKNKATRVSDHDQLRFEIQIFVDIPLSSTFSSGRPKMFEASKHYLVSQQVKKCTPAFQQSSLKLLWWS